MLDNEYKYYLNNKDILDRKYSNKFIVIKNNKIIGVYDTNQDAYIETSKTEKLGTFLIQYSGINVPTQEMFHSRVVF